MEENRKTHPIQFLYHRDTSEKSWKYYFYRTLYKQIGNKFEKIYEIDVNPETRCWVSDVVNKPIAKKSDLIPHFGSIYIKGDDGTKEKVNEYSYQADLAIPTQQFLREYGDLESLEKIPLRIGYLDLECLIEGRITTNGKYPISAISIYDSFKEKLFTFAFDKKLKKNKSDNENKILIFNDEVTMLNSFVRFMQIAKYDVLTGWNITFFDIPYLCNRLENVGIGMNQLSPININGDRFKLVEKNWKRNEGERDSFTIFGTSVVDYLELYKKYTWRSLSSFSLNNVADEELGEGKIDFEGSINDLYLNNLAKYIEYNRKDVMLVKKMEDKCGYLDLLDSIRRIGMCNIESAMSTSQVIDNLIIRVLNKNGYVVRSKKFHEKKESYTGAYVKTPIPGIYDWVICNDFTSLYPFIMMNFNISPETKVGKIVNEINGDIFTMKNIEYTYRGKFSTVNHDEFYSFLSKENLIVAANGVIYRKERGIYKRLIEWLFAKRVENRDLMDKYLGEGNKQKANIYKTIQSSYKLIMNSFYGFAGFSGSRFFDVDTAEAVTVSGQSLIKHAIKKLEEKGYTVITSDTDSIYFTCDDVNDAKAGVKRGIEIKEFIGKELKEYCKIKFNVQDSNFEFKFEKVAKRAVFFKKKHYILNVVNEKERDVDEISFTGVAVKKSDTTIYSKRYLKRIYELVLRENDFKKIDTVIKEFRNNLKLVPKEEIGIPISVTKKLSDYTKNVPMHIRGARYWEEKLAEKEAASFDSIFKGKMYFVKNLLTEEDEKKYGDKDPVICVPDGKSLPLNFILDYDRIEERVINKRLDNLVDILDNIKAKEHAEEYKEFNTSDLVKKLRKELKSELDKIDYVKNNKLHMISYKKRFIKIINDTFQSKIFDILIKDLSLGDEIYNLVMQDAVYLEISRKQNEKEEKKRLKERKKCE